jgi:chemotaxis protein MotB
MFNVRKIALLGMLVALVVMAGCSCKEYEEQIMQLDAQIAELQKEIANDEAMIAERNEIVEDLKGNLNDCKSVNAVLIEENEEVVMITVQEGLVFVASGVGVREEMVPTLEGIAMTIRDHPDWDVYVEGYTDNRKVKEEYQEYYPSNWELGAFRSAAVVRYMTGQMGLDPERFAAVSFGPFRAIADNDTEEGRSQNRRVRFVMYKPER